MCQIADFIISLLFSFYHYCVFFGTYELWPLLSLAVLESMGRQLCSVSYYRQLENTYLAREIRENGVKH